MSCIWCSNPENIEPYQRIGVYPERCISKHKCGKCVGVCLSKDARIEFDESGLLKTLLMSADCSNCLECVDVCPQKAIKLWGEQKTLPELMRIIKSDRSFYDRSGGGVTLNGGEVIMQWEFAEMLLKACKETGIHTCVETALHCPAEHMETLYRYTDLVIADIKHMDSVSHKRITGAGNEIILSNLVKTVNLGKKLIVRTPVVPGYNGDEQSMRAIGKFIRDELNGDIVSWELLPFRKLGTEKYASLMLEYPMEDYKPQKREEWERELARLAMMLNNEYGLPVIPV